MNDLAKTVLSGDTDLNLWLLTTKFPSVHIWAFVPDVNLVIAQPNTQFAFKDASSLTNSVKCKIFVASTLVLPRGQSLQISRGTVSHEKDWSFSIIKVNTDDFLASKMKWLELNLNKTQFSASCFHTWLWERLLCCGHAPGCDVVDWGLSPQGFSIRGVSIVCLTCLNSDTEETASDKSPGFNQFTIRAISTFLTPQEASLCSLSSAGWRLSTENPPVFPVRKVAPSGTSCWTGCKWNALRALYTKQSELTHLTNLWIR